MARTPRAPSLWLDPPPEPGPPLEGDIEVDCVVIGAGYTGLSAALALRAEGAEVAVLERDYAGFGASGRNAGHLTPTIGKDVPTLLRIFGRERALALVRLAETAVEHVEATIAARGIDCDYVPNGNLLGGVHRGQAQAIERAAAAAREAGADVELLTEAQIRDRGLPAAFVCGYLERRGGVLDPGKYVRGLRQAALDAGVKLYEQTRADAIVDELGLLVETPRGRVSAQSGILATNAYTQQLGRMGSTITPLSVSLFATAPLDDEARSRVGWPGREGIYTTHEILESYRLTADERIVGGSRHIRYGYGGRIPPDEDPRVFDRLAQMLRNRFPELATVDVERFWSGPISITLDFLPAIGRTGKGGRIAYWVGCAGHGVALASHAGTLLAKLALGRDPGHPEIVGRRHPPLPPEPLRWLFARGIIGALNLVDRRHDRLARRRQPAAAQRPAPRALA